MNKHVEVLIVGSGLSGLMAAKKCKDEGREYLVLEKAKGTGGRMATRRLAGGRADHGAQFFTARSETMKKLVQSWLDADIISVWSNGFHQIEANEKGSVLTLNHDGYPRYIGKNGMNSIMKFIADGLEIQTNSKVSKISYENKWVVSGEMDEEAFTYTADALVLSAPVPQSLQLLEAGNVALESNILSELSQLSYFPCLCAMLALDKAAAIPEPGGIQAADGKVSFIGDNEKKGISETPIVTIHGAEEWSRLHFEKDQDWILDQLTNMAAPFLVEARITERQLMKWRYSKPEKLHQEEYAGLLVPGPLVLTGDIFKQGKVEGAILSGIAGIDWLLQQLS